MAKNIFRQCSRYERMATIGKKSDSVLMQTLLTERSAASRVDSRRAVSLWRENSFSPASSL